MNGMLCGSSFMTSCTKMAGSYKAAAVLPRFMPLSLIALPVVLSSPTPHYASYLTYGLASASTCAQRHTCRDDEYIQAHLRSCLLVLPSMMSRLRPEWRLGRTRTPVEFVDAFPDEDDLFEHERELRHEMDEDRRRWDHVGGPMIAAGQMTYDPV